MNTFDFEYSHPSGAPVIVEVDYYYEEPNPLSTESDWDYYGGLIIVDIRFYSGIEEVFDIDFTQAEIAYQFKKYVEDAEMRFIMETNESF